MARKGMNATVLQHNAKVLRNENKALHTQLDEFSAPLSEREQIRERLAAGLDPLINAILACQAVHNQNEADKQRVTELLDERAPFVSLPEGHIDREKLILLDKELHEIRRRIDLFPHTIRKLYDAEKQQRQNFAGV